MTFYLKYCEIENQRDATGKTSCEAANSSKAKPIIPGEDIFVNTDRRKMTSGAYRRNVLIMIRFISIWVDKKALT